MIELSDKNYTRLVDGRNAMAAALQRLVEASDAVAGQNVSANLELAGALEAANDVLAEYGAHQAFVLI